MARDDPWHGRPGVKNTHFAKDVGSEIVEMVLTVEMLRARHRRRLHHLSQGRIHKNQCMRHPSVGESTNLKRLGF
jgi:hypothetical protein